MFSDQGFETQQTEVQAWLCHKINKLCVCDFCHATISELGWKVKVKVSFAQSCLTVFPWTRGHQASLSMEFSRQEYWSGLPFPSPGVFLTQGLNQGSPALQVDSLPSELSGKPMWKGEWHLKEWGLLQGSKFEEICFLLKNQYKSIIKYQHE